jgi:hypothetical protein
MELKGQQSRSTSSGYIVPCGIHYMELKEEEKDEGIRDYWRGIHYMELKVSFPIVASPCLVMNPLHGVESPCNGFRGSPKMLL